MIPTKESITQAHEKIKKYIHKTPLLSSQSLSKLSGTASIYLKCQNFQKVGAFKARGACNKIINLDSNIKSICTHSSGNHAMAVAYIAREFGLTAYVIMPQNSPPLKKRCVQGYGANVIISENNIEARQQACKQTCQKYNATLVHPYNDYLIIEGQATCAKQIFDQMPNKFDYVVFPIGGGGLGSGTLLSTKYFGNGCKAIGVEPELAGDAYLSIRDKKIHPQFPPVTIADGLRVNLGEIPFSILSKQITVEDIILVTEKEIIDAMQLVFERMKLVIEASSATTVAAVMKDERFKNKNVCCLISAGNIDMASFFDMLRDKVKA